MNTFRKFQFGSELHRLPVIFIQKNELNKIKYRFGLNNFNNVDLKKILIL